MIILAMLVKLQLNTFEIQNALTRHFLLRTNITLHRYCSAEKLLFLWKNSLFKYLEAKHRRVAVYVHTETGTE